MPVTDHDAYRGMNYEIAETVASGWERHRATIERVCAPARDWLIAALDPQPGQTLLELAAGTGDTGFQAASRLGENGRLISSDFSPEMLAGAKRRGAELGVQNAEYRVIDAERIELADDSVDGALCRLGYMLMADPAQALAETRRVLRPSGRLALAVWGPAEQNPFFTAAVIPLVQEGHMPPPEPDAPGLFSMAGAERVAALLRGAGFETVRVEEVPVTFALPDIDAYLEFVGDTAGSVALLLRGLGAGQRTLIRERSGEALARYAAKDGYEVPGLMLCASAS